MKKKINQSKTETENSFDLIHEWREKKNPQILDKIILNHYLMIQSIANHYRNLNIDHEDLVSEGLLGMLVALDKYDLSKQIKFSTYAHFWIKAKILNFIKKVKPYFISIQTSSANLEHLENDDYLHFEDLEQAKEHLNHIKKKKLIKLGIQDNEQFSSIESYKKGIEETTVQKDFEELFRLSILSLSTREKIILDKKWLNKETISTKEIAQELKLSEERIRQIEKEIFQKLRAVFKQKFGSIRGELFFSQFIFAKVFQNFKNLKNKLINKM